MGFLQNKNVNLVNVHFGLSILGESMTGLFLLAYLYQSGFAAWQAALVYAAAFGLRFFLRFVLFPVVTWLGLKRSILLGTVAFACQHLALSQVASTSWGLYAYLVAVSFTGMLYWMCYHAYFAQLGDDEHRGKQSGVREVVVAAASIVAPVVSGVIILHYGYTWSFAVAGTVSLLSAVPLFFVPDVPLKKISMREARKTVDTRGFWYLLGDSWFMMGYLFVWSFILFFVADERHHVFGGLLALAAFLQVVGNLVFGHLVDLGRGAWIWRIGCLLMVATTLGRAGLAHAIPFVIAFDVFNAVARGFYGSTFGPVLYNLSKRSKSSLHFQAFAETGWDIGAVSYLCLAALLAYLDIDLRYTLALAVLGVPVFAYIMWQYYERDPKQHS